MLVLSVVYDLSPGESGPIPASAITVFYKAIFIHC